jgi:exopolysaccharide biosynthesis protein
MKKNLLLLVAAMFALSTTAQNTDSVTLVNAPRQELKLPRGAKGYTILRANILNSYQTISVIRYSPKRFKTQIVQPEKLTRLSETAKSVNGDFGVNAGYWDVRVDKPSTFVKLDGKQISVTADFEKERVDGLVCIDKKYIVIDHCKAGKESLYAAIYDNILASGPVLIDEGEQVDHDAYTKGMVDNAGGKPVGAFYTYTQRHPRTAIGTDKKGNVYLVVVDGRSEGNAEGVTIAEFTKVCAWLGLHDAINLDGGGSSSMWTAEEGTVSYPCRNKKFDHEGERRVSSIISVRRK